MIINTETDLNVLDMNSSKLKSCIIRGCDIMSIIHLSFIINSDLYILPYGFIILLHRHSIECGKHSDGPRYAKLIQKCNI